MVCLYPREIEFVSCFQSEHHNNHARSYRYFFSSFSSFFPFFFFLIIVSVGAADFLFQSQLLVSDCCSDSQLNPVKIRQNYGGSASQKVSRVWLLGLRDEKSSMKLEHWFSVSYTEDLLQAIDYISVFLNHYFRCLNYS